MSHRQRPQGLRLRIDYGVHVLTSISGREAYWVPRQRAEEASSEDMARDWTAVAAATARRSGRRHSFFGGMFRRPRGRAELSRSSRAQFAMRNEIPTQKAP